MRLTDPRLRAQLVVAKWPLAAVLVGSGVGALLVIAQAFAVAGLIVAVVDGAQFSPWAGAVLLVFAGRAVSGLLVDIAAARASAMVGVELRRRVLESCLEPVGALDGRSSGEVATLVTRGVSAAEPYITRYLPAMVLAATLPLLTVVSIATQDVMSAVIVMATLPLIPVFGVLVGLATRDEARKQWAQLEMLSGHFVDVMKGLPTLVVFRRARAQSAVIRSMTQRYREATLRTLRIAFLSSAILELVATLSVALVAVVVGVRLAHGGLDLFTALVVLLLAPEAYWPLRRAGAEFHAAAEGAATFEKLADTAVAPAARGTVGPRGEALTFSDLSVTYPDRRSPALAAVTGRVAPRGVTAIVGPSGCGKSTLLAALMGLVPATGTRRVGDAEVDGETWRSQIAWLPQRPTFSGSTVAADLRIADPSASDDQLWAALRQVALDERVRTLGGLDAAIGEDARLLSAGERARLALARVVVASRPWVFLDEPTAHLDPLTEQVVADTIVDLSRRSGVLVVAHTSSLIARADQVIALDAPPVKPRPVRLSEDARPRPLPTMTVDAARPRFVLSTGLGAAASASGVALTATAGWLIVKAAEQPAILTLLVAIVGVRAFGLARPVLRYAERLRSHDAALRLLAERRVQVYDAVVPLTPGGLGVRRGDALASIVDDVESVLDRELRVRIPVRGFVLVAACATAVAAALHPPAGLVVGATSVLGAAWAYGVAGWVGRAPERAVVAARAELSDQVLATVQSAPELVMWQAGRRAVVAALAPARLLARASERSGAGLALARAGAVVAAGSGLVLVGSVVSSAVADGSLSGPMAALLTLMPLALLEVVAPLADAGAMRRRTAAADRRLHAIEERRPLVVDPAEAARSPHGSGIVVDSVTAGWGVEPVLRDLTLRVDPGARVGIVGPSGCGKSTLAALLLRFLDPADGAVEFGGVGLPALPLDDIRTAVGLVDDDPHVFASTVAENVRLARPTASDDAVESVLRRAQLGAWLDDLPNGLQTQVGDGHAQVSGGERARLAVARVLLADPDVLVLDEPTASLDTATAEAVAVDLMGAVDGRSVVWITHGEVGLREMDTVVDLGGSAPVSSRLRSA